MNTSHKRVRARVEHSLSRLKCWKILRDYRRAATTLHDTASGITYLHNIALAALTPDPHSDQHQDQLRDIA